jgi:hypothetical protein
MDTLSWLYLTAIFLVIAGLIVTVAPLLLRRLAGGNSQSRGRLARDLGKLSQAQQQLRARLAPYAPLQAAAYRRRYEQAENHLAAVQRHCLPAARLNELALPHIPPLAWPGRFFGRQPHQILAIPWTTVQLWRFQRALARAEQAATGAARELNELERVPERLQQRCATLLDESVPRLARELEAERRAGVTALRDLETLLDQKYQAVARLCQALPAVAERSLAEADRLAEELDRLQTAVAQLENDVAGIREERAALDVHLNRVETAFAQLTAPYRDRPIPSDLYPVLDRIGDLTAGAHRRRQGRGFEEAAKLLEDAEQLLELAQQAQATLAAVQVLNKIREGALIDGNINQIEEQWRQAAVQCGNLMAREEWQHLPEPLPELVFQTAAQMTATFHALEAEAEQLLRTHEQQVNDAERRADQAVGALRTAWDQMQQQITLDQDDRATRFYLLLQQREAACGQPRPLADFAQGARAFAGELRADTAQIKEWLLAINLQYESVADAVAYAGEQTQEWPCLAAPIEQLCALARQCETTWRGATSAGTWEKTLEAGHRVKQLVKEIVLARSGIEEHVRHLNWLTSQVAECLAREVDESDRITRLNAERLRRQGRELVTAARHAHSFAEALTFLEEAFTTAKPLLAVPAPAHEAVPHPVQHRPSTGFGTDLQ